MLRGFIGAGLGRTEGDLIPNAWAQYELEKTRPGSGRLLASAAADVES
jgi:hypothetical protein